jgi:hypothetical protein
MNIEIHLPKPIENTAFGDFLLTKGNYQSNIATPIREALTKYRLPESDNALLRLLTESAPDAPKQVVIEYLYEGDYKVDAKNIDLANTTIFTLLKHFLPPEKTASIGDDGSILVDDRKIGSIESFRNETGAYDVIYVSISELESEIPGYTFERFIEDYTRVARTMFEELNPGTLCPTITYY